MRAFFRLFAQHVATAMGSPWAFLLALLVVLVWAVSGPIFGYSDSWQLTINTGTTIVTFLMVFLIQNTQNRDARVVHLKLDELIRAVAHARNELVDMEALSDEELERLERQFAQLHEHALEHRSLRARQGGHDSARRATARRSGHHEED